MASFNRITLVGYLGADPQTNDVSGNKVANFNLATNHVYTNAQKERVENTTWFRVAVWGRQAEVAEQYLKKGSQVYIEGELTTREYMDSNNINRTSLEVRATTMKLMGSRNEANSNEQPYQAPRQQSSAVAQEEKPHYTQMGNSAPDDDLPF